MTKFGHYIYKHLKQKKFQTHRRSNELFTIICIGFAWKQVQWRHDKFRQ